MALYTLQVKDLEDNKYNKGGLDSRRLSDDGNIAKLATSTSCHGFE
jgi:hypothetical protein